MRVPWTWLAVGLGLVLAVVFVAVGLESADKVASVVGALAGLVSLGLALSAARRPGRAAEAAETAEAAGTRPPDTLVDRTGRVHQGVGGVYTNTGVHHGDVTNVSFAGSPLTAALAVLLVAALVFGLLYLLVIRDGTARANDEALRLVDFEYGPDQTLTTSIDSRESPTPGEPTSGTGRRRPVVVTLRNPTDDTAVLTAVKVVVHQIFVGASCGEPEGQGLWSSFDFAFRIPEDATPPWEQTNPQNFTVAPHAVDALSVTIGPEREEWAAYVWSFSVSAVSETGRETHWGDAVGIDLPESSAADLRAYVWGRDYPDEGVSRDRIRACAKDHLADLEPLFLPIDGRKKIVQPEAEYLVAEYRRAAGP